MKPSRAMNRENLMADVVIIGGGGAGLAAAVAAAEKGASVIILEKRKVMGGNAVFAEGFFAAESPAQQRMNIDANRDELFRTAMSYSHWTLNPRILRAFIDKSSDTVRWLEEKGLIFDWIPPLYPNQVPLVWHCLKGRGAVIVRLLRQYCEKLHVRILLQTPAKKILKDKQEQVTGVLATTQGNELRIRAKNVIIATGGYGGNKEMLKKYSCDYTENLNCGGLPHMGDGILMALEAGAESEGLGIIQLMGPGLAVKGPLSAMATEPTTIWVNNYGERFTDEMTAYNIFESINPLLRQPGRVCYSLFDESIVKGVIDEGLIKGAGILIVPPRTKIPRLHEELQALVKKGYVKIANTWTQIAKWIGTPPNALQNTIDEYNACCDRGHDAVFVKDRRYLVPLRTPPYYAMKCGPGLLGTIGGIKINQHMEVISKQGKPIPGLYATGVDTGGWESETYCAVLSGSTFGFALNSGRIAGENAATFALGK